MSGMIATTVTGTTEKQITLTKYTPHDHSPNPIEPKFTPPKRVKNLSFRPIALAAAVARTATTLEDAPVTLLNAILKSALPMLKELIVDGSVFELSAHFPHLADAERTFFAARIGAGITDLYMNALGYSWRANAACLASTVEPHPDFIYEGGNARGLGVVLAEAHGSFAANATVRSVHLQSKNKYLKQVKPHLAKSSPHGKTIHGYSIAFGSTPGAPGAYLSLSETKVAKPKSSMPASSSLELDEHAAPSSIVLTSHRSNFFLMGAEEVVRWIDWLRRLEAAPPALSAVEFIRLQYAGKRYWVRPPFWTLSLNLLDQEHLWWRLRSPHALDELSPDYAWFAMEENAAKDFLGLLTDMIRDGQRISQALALRTPQPSGFGFDAKDFQGDRPDYNYALFRDGLALLGDIGRGKLLGRAMWNPKEGPLTE